MYLQKEGQVPCVQTTKSKTGTQKGEENYDEHDFTKYRGRKRPWDS